MINQMGPKPRVGPEHSREPSLGWSPKNSGNPSQEAQLLRILDDGHLSLWQNAGGFVVHERLSYGGAEEEGK